MAGPVNRSMGGATTAAPLDAMGALYWNPATLSGLAESELGFGADMLFAVTDLFSTVGPVSGATKGDPGGVLIPNIAWSHRRPNSRVTLGLGILSAAGFKTNYPSDLSNPILTPQPNGVGRIYSEAAFAQITPVASFKVTDRLSLAAGPMITVGTLAADPLLFVAPNGNGYPPGRGSKVRYGAGVQAGVFYEGEGAWNFGASIKSQQWIQDFEFTTEDGGGGPRFGHVNVDLPLIFSAGVAYKGFDRTIVAVDYRYFGFKGTEGLGDEGFEEDGTLRGLAWNDVNAVAAGIQYRLSDVLTVRGGYGINQTPIDPDNSGVNVASPLVQDQVWHLGGSYALDSRVTLNAAYTYFPPNEISGPLTTFIQGPLPGSNVGTRLSVHTMSFGLTVRY